MSEDEIFQKGSKTYYNATKLFPVRERQYVTRLYSFVRVADDYIDATPQQITEFAHLESLWSAYVRDGVHPEGEGLNQRVTRNMIKVTEECGIETEWVDAFLASMRADIHKKTYETIDELQQYIYGSAEVIGLMMVRILRISDDSHTAARSQGSAMQLINFIRDVAEDQRLGRQYLPREEMRALGLQELSYEAARSNPEAFHRYINMQLNRYRQWQATADAGMHYLPPTLRRAVQVATDGYNWTAKQIARDPISIFRTQHKPPKAYLLWRAIVRGIGA